MAKLMTAEQRRRLQQEWAEREAAMLTRPILKLFTPDAGATWLIAALSPDERIAWGVVDLGLGFIEVGEVDMAELKANRGRLGLPVERDRWFTPSMTVGEYQREGALQGRLVV